MADRQHRTDFLATLTAGVAKQERTTFAKVVRHTMMRMVGRKPVYLRNLTLEMPDCAIADVLEFQPICLIGALVADGSDPAPRSGSQEPHRRAARS